MTSTPLKPAEIKPPAHLSRAENAAFRRAIREFLPDLEVLSPALAEDFWDFMQARWRIAALQRLLDRQIEYSEQNGIVRSEIIPLSRQIDATVALSHKLADKLEIKS